MAKRRKKGSDYTPKAEDRHWYERRQTARAAKSAARTGTATIGPRRGAEPAHRRRRTDGPELVTGRNPVVEALRAGVPASTLYVMSGVSDQRVRESIKLAADAGGPLLDARRH